MGPPTTTPIDVARLSVGDVLDMSIFDQNGMLLLRSGTPVTDSMLRQLRQRNIKTVQGRSDSGQGSGGGNEASGASHDSASPPSLKPPSLEDDRLDRFDASSLGFPDADQRRTQRLDLEALRSVIYQGADQRADTIEQFPASVENVLRGGGGVAAVERSVESLFALVRRDSSVAALITRIGEYGGRNGDYLYEHSVNSCLMTLSLAYHMGFSEAQVVEAGVGAMLHDIGMLRLPSGLRYSPRPLSSAEWALVRTHPVHSANALDRAGRVPMLSRLIAYQCHERANGSGYPRGRRGMFIHPLAQLAGLADAFCAMIEPRAYRRPILPFDAMRQLMFAVKQGAFDAGMVRAALDHLSAYPVGSYVKLSDGRVARVIRANGAAHTRPVVVPIDERGREAPFEVDLSYFEELSVTSAVSSRQVPQVA